MKINSFLSKNKIKIKLFLKYFFIIEINASIVLFVSFVMFFYHANIDIKTLEMNAICAIINILFLSIMFTIIALLYRKYFIVVPTKAIVDATKKLTDGIFSTRIKRFNFKAYGLGDQLNEIVDQINILANELELVESFSNDVFSNISHELKTPLSIIDNYSKLLSMPNISDDQRIEYVSLISQTVKKLNILISNILKLNKLENQQIILNKDYYNLTEQILESILHFESIIDEKKLSIKTDIDEIQIYADNELLSIVWQNLLSNAIKFSDCNGEICISAHEISNKIIITIKDNGCGIDQKSINHIFDKFYQCDMSHSSDGNGLGLALVKRIIDLLNGEIVVESKLDVGTTFTIKLNNIKINKEL